MTVEIRELKIKGIVSQSINKIEKEFENRNSNIQNTFVIKNLKKQILDECKDLIQNELEKRYNR